MLTFGGGDDLVRTGSPYEGAEIFVGSSDEAVDEGLKIDQGMEDAMIKTPLLFHVQARLGVVERLDLASLVNARDGGAGGRIDVKPSDIARFADKVQIAQEFGSPVALRRQTTRITKRILPLGSDHEEDEFSFFTAGQI